MTSWEEAIEATTAQFIEGLEQRGFRADGSSLSGVIPGDPSPVRIEIEIPEEFPFVPPVVSPPEDFPRSWHRELSGAMCLYAADGRENLPWLDINDFIQVVSRWLKASVNGWADDTPDLDLERYFNQVDEPLVVYGDLDLINNKFIQLRHGKQVTRVVGAGSIPKGTKGLSKGRAFGYVAAIGEPSTPPTSWDDLKAMIPASDAKAIATAVRDMRLEYLIVRYTRGGVEAAVTLRARRSNTGTIELAAIRSASEAPSTLLLRAGPGTAPLANAKVVVVGAGAIGSFLCDLMARAGVGTITAYDPGVMSPGNLIRHLAAAQSVGLSKPEAVARAIEPRPFNRSKIIPVAESIPAPSQIMSLFTENDLVVDASAAGGTTDLLAKAAIAGGHHLVSVCLQEAGHVVRVDVIPPLHGNPIPRTTLGPPPAREDLRFEAGCGDPVSPTPAFAVFEAASLAARCAIGMLTDTPIPAAGIIRDYR